MGFGKDGTGVIIRYRDNNDSLDSLAAGTVVKSNALTMTEKFRLISIKEFFFSVQGLTGDESVHVGIASNELSVAEIKDAIEAQGPVGRDDYGAMADAELPVWILGQYSAKDGSAPAAATIGGNNVPIEKTIRWTFGDSGFVVFWYNHTNANFSAGTQIGRFYGKFFGVWV